MKKLLSLLIVGLFTAVGSFASADSISCNGYNNCVPNQIKVIGGISCVITSRYPYSADCSVPIDEYNGSYSLSFNVYDNDGNSLGSNSIFCGQSNCKLSSLPLGNFSVDLTSYDTLILKNITLKNSSDDNSFVISSSYFVDDTPIVPDTPTDDNNSDSLLNPGVISSGVQSGVTAFTNGLGGLIPTLLLFGLYIVVIYWGWDIIRSWIKHIFVVDKPRGDDIANCNLTLDKYGQFEHHVIGQYDHGDYVDVPGVGLVGKDELPYYLDENLEFNYKEYKQDHETFDNRDPGIPGDDYYKRSEDVDEQSRIYQKYL